MKLIDCDQFQVYSHEMSIRDISVQGNLLASGSMDNSVEVTDMEKNEQLFKFQHDDSVTCVKLSGRRLITGGRDGTVRIWSLDTGKQIDKLVSKSKCQNFDLRFE